MLILIAMLKKIGAGGCGTESYVCTCVCMYVYVCTYVRMYARVYVYTCVCMYVRMGVRVCVCMYGRTRPLQKSFLSV